MKIFFTWWNKKTFGTFLKTLFFGKYVGSDEFGNKYYRSKKMSDGLCTNKIEATKITSDWYLWIHHTIDKIPDSKDKKIFMAKKKHQENQTGTQNSFKPIKYRKTILRKNMKHGNKIILIFIFIFIFYKYQFCRRENYHCSFIKC